MTKTRTYTKEADVKAEVKKLLTQHGWFWWMPPANGYGRTGISDIHALRDGKFLAIETKFGKNTVTTMQQRFMDDVVAAQGQAAVVSEKTLDEFVSLLQAHHAVP
jgi:hypothetical protein